MADIVTPAVRSRMMSRIGGRNTKPELRLRSQLHRLGYRYRLHEKRLEGRPDIALPRYRAAIFVNGCFWHRHEGCRYTTVPSSNADFWGKKFARNVARDERNVTALRAKGWRVATVWECAIGPAGLSAENVLTLVRWLAAEGDAPAILSID